MIPCLALRELSGRLTLAAALFAVLSFGLSGCGKQDPHADHDHDHDHASHEHHDHNDDPHHGDGAQVDLEDPALAEQLAAYPLDVCVVSNERLGSHGKPVNVVHEGVLVRLCCGGCIDEFEDDPQAYLSRLQAAHADEQGG